MAWIESHQSLSRHKKTMRVVALLGVDRHKLIGHLHELWWWALDNVPADGCLGDLTDEEIAAAAEWSGDAAQFVQALTAARFIDQRRDGRYLHDWWDYAGKLLDRRDRDRQRKRLERRWRGPQDARPGSGTDTPAGPEDVQRTSGGSPVDVQGMSDTTQPNPTVPNPTEPDVVLSKESSKCVDPVVLSSLHRAESAEPSPAAPATPDEPPPPRQARRLRVWGEDTEEYRLARLLRDEIVRNLPTARVPKETPAAMAPWCRQIDLLLRVDKRAPPEVERVIRWCQKDPFWQSNVLSPKKLREKWDTLVLQMRRRETDHGRTGGNRADSGQVAAKNRAGPQGAGGKDTRPDYWSGVLGRRAVNRVPHPAGAGAEGTPESNDTS